MLTSLVAESPMPFSAVHLYNPSFCLPVMFNNEGTGLLSGTFVHMMLGGGLPSAVQMNGTTSVSFTILLSEMYMMLGGSKTIKQNIYQLEATPGKVTISYFTSNVMI